MLVGCSTTVPVTSKFPEAPKYSLQPCPQLQLLKEGSKLSEVTTTVTINYSTYSMIYVLYTMYIVPQ